MPCLSKPLATLPSPYKPACAHTALTQARSPWRTCRPGRRRARCSQRGAGTFLCKHKAMRRQNKDRENRPRHCNALPPAPHTACPGWPSAPSRPHSERGVSARLPPFPTTHFATQYARRSGSVPCDLLCAAAQATQHMLARDAARSLSSTLPEIDVCVPQIAERHVLLYLPFPFLFLLCAPREL